MATRLALTMFLVIAALVVFATGGNKSLSTNAVVAPNNAEVVVSDGKTIHVFTDWK
jgi:hypothetical protein